MAITSETFQTPPPQQDLAEIPGDEDIKAAPLELPDWSDVKAKQAGISLRWVNNVWQNGLRYTQMTYAGFVNASPNDVKGIPSSYFKEGKIINGDLILMKIDDKKYKGAIKYRREQAMRRTSKFGQEEQHRQHIKQQMAETGASARAQASIVNKIRVESPSGQDLERLVGPDRPVQTPNPPGPGPASAGAPKPQPSQPPK